MKIRIGKRLQQLRALYNVSIEDLAGSTGIPVSTLGRIENGTVKNLKLTIILKLLKHFNIPFEVLVCGDYYTSKLQISKQIISNLYTLLMDTDEAGGNKKAEQIIDMIDLSDKATYEFIKLLYAYTDRKDIPQNIIPYIIGVEKQRVAQVIKKYRIRR
ncbi:MAG: helix-turn-helix transcriptional regulator [Spirochaetales bacterium]|nr:helix-turn-helix transcriptional regulator [Spirochaetales bacterium]